MSSPNSNVATTMDMFSEDMDRISSRPLIPSMASSMGSVTSRTTASGFAEGYTVRIVMLGNSISGKSSLSKRP